MNGPIAQSFAPVIVRGSERLLDAQSTIRQLRNILDIHRPANG